MLIRAAEDLDCVFDRYEEFKRQFTDTAQLCDAQGFVFTPMVVESHSGAWSSNARQVFSKIAAAQSSVTNVSSDIISLAIAQRLSIALHRENARAIVKRMVAPTHETARVTRAGPLVRRALMIKLVFFPSFINCL